MKNVEVEIKYVVKEPKKIRIILDKVAKKEKINEPQVDTYFRLKNNDFVLRLRKSKKGYFLSYIKLKAKYAAYYYSTQILDHKNTLNLLDKLGTKKFVIIRKTRSSWLFKDVEFTLDFLKNKGYFLEIEALKNKETISATVKHLKSIIEQLNLPVDRIVFSGYTSL